MLHLSKRVFSPVNLPLIVEVGVWPPNWRCRGGSLQLQPDKAHRTDRISAAIKRLEPVRYEIDCEQASQAERHLIR
jgi:hypothetical protein